MTNTQKIRKLYSIDNDTDFGFSIEEITELEKRIHIALPAALSDYYLSLGNHERLNYSHNRLLKPGTEVDFSSDRYLMIFEENQGVVSWGIKEEDLAMSDPAVWGNAGTEENPDWYLETKSTDNFFLLMAVYNGTLGGLAYNANYLETVEPGIVKFIEDTWKIVPDISYEKQKIYTNDFDEVISLSFDENAKCNAVFVGTSIRERFDSMLDEIAVNWSYTSYEDEDAEEDFEDE